ncbi:MAG: hypothetical protein HYX97_04985 [Chloroflexi bacterium]|nr:hypothetical protein [Chloroflexota bacterium]
MKQAFLYTSLAMKHMFEGWGTFLPKELQDKNKLLPVVKPKGFHYH